MKNRSHIFSFSNNRVTVGTDTKRHGIISMEVGNSRSNLIREPLFGLNIYRLMSDGRLMGIARDEPFDVIDSSTHSVTLGWKSTNTHPCHMDVKYELKDENIIDVTLFAEARQSLNRYEISISSYFDFSLEPYVIISSWPGREDDAALRLLKVEDHPYIKGYYFCLPRDQKAVHTRMDGRWVNPDTNQMIAHYAVGPYYGRPITIMANETMYVVQMTEPEHCNAVDVTYSSYDHSDKIMGHNATYHTLFGDDLEQGDTRRARMRQVLCRGKVNLTTVLNLYDQFLTHLKRL